MIRQVGGELRKLIGPALFVILAIFVTIVWQDARSTSHFASMQTPVGVAVSRDNEATYKTSCSTAEEEATDTCYLMRETNKLNRYFESNSIALGQIATSLNTLPGLLKFGSHQMATGIGWITIGLLAISHITRESTTGTVRDAVRINGRRRYALVKYLSLVIGSILILLAATAVLYLIRSTFMRSIGVPPPGSPDIPEFRERLIVLEAEPSWSSWAAGLRSAAQTAGLVAVICVPLTAVSLFFKRSLTAFVAVCLSVGGLFLVAQSENYRSWTPMRAVSDAFNLDRVPYGIRDVRLWDTGSRAGDIYAIGLGEAPWLVSLITWTGIALLVSALLARRFLSRDVLE